MRQTEHMRMESKKHTRIRCTRAAADNWGKDLTMGLHAHIVNMRCVRGWPSAALDSEGNADVQHCAAGWPVVKHQGFCVAGDLLSSKHEE
eukprot:scaffold228709_cov18-Tisochrysis_lutea.AAC.2